MSVNIILRGRNVQHDPLKSGSKKAMRRCHASKISIHQVQSLNTDGG